MRFATAAVGLVIAGLVAMGCSPSVRAPATPSPAATTTLTNTTLEARPEPILPYVDFDDEDDDETKGPNDLVQPTWGAAYAAYAGFDPELGF